MTTGQLASRWYYVIYISWILREWKIKRMYLNLDEQHTDLYSPHIISYIFCGKSKNWCCITIKINSFLKNLLGIHIIYDEWPNQVKINITMVWPFSFIPKINYIKSKNRKLGKLLF